MTVRSLLGPVCLLSLAACAAAASKPPLAAPAAAAVPAPAPAGASARPSSTPAPRPAPTATTREATSTPASSCPTVEAAACGGATLKYAGEVRTILERRCFSCHANDGIAADEHDLSKFTVAHAQRTEIAAMMKECAMPPKGAPPLPGEERRTLLSWAECGAPP